MIMSFETQNRVAKVKACLLKVDIEGSFLNE